MAATVGPDECKAYGSVGKLASHMEAKIVDPATGEALGPGQRGELWVRGPVIMKGKRLNNSFGLDSGLTLWRL